MTVRSASYCAKFPNDLAKLHNNVTQQLSCCLEEEGYTGGMVIALSQATRTEIAPHSVAAGFFEIGGQDMIPETSRNPHSNLPFELFRSFGPMFDKHRPFTAWTPPCDIYETDKEIVLKMELPEMRKENVLVALAEFKEGMLTVTFARRS